MTYANEQECKNQWGCDCCGACGEYWYDCDCPDEKVVLTALQKLLYSFDTKDGLPQACYEAACELLTTTMGRNACNFFCTHIKALPGHRYCLPEEINKMEMWNELRQL